LGGDSDSIRLGTGPVDSHSHRAGQALAVAVDRHSDSLTLTVEPIGTASERLYAASERAVGAVGVDNTTLYRANQNQGAFDLDPVESLPHQGFMYGRLDHYWLTATDLDSTGGRDSIANLPDEVTVYPVQPGTPSRLVAGQLLREAGLWNAVRIDNRPRQQVPEAVEAGEIDVFPAVEINGQELAPWCQEIDDRVGERLGVLPVDDTFQSTIETAPNAITAEIEPTGWERADLPSAIDGWSLPRQWLFDATVDSEAVAELTRVAHEETETIQSVDRLALDRTEPTVMTAGVIPEIPVHEGVVSVFESLGVWESEWTRGNAVE
jgi:TRAP-type uncharacterized transport system substrate-binding protein